MSRSLRVGRVRRFAVPAFVTILVSVMSLHVPEAGARTAHYDGRYTDVYETGKDRYQAHIHLQPVNYRDADGKWRPVSDKLIAVGSGYENQANSFQVHLPTSVAQTPVTVSDGGYQLQMTTLGVSASAKAIVSGASATYRDAFPGVTERYSVGPDHLQESFVLTSARVSPIRFALRLSKGLGLTQTGGVLTAHNSKGEVAFMLPAPYMESEASASASGGGFTELGAVHVSMERAGGETLVTYTPDHAWLTAPGRSFPVVLDPSVGEGASSDCTLSEGSTAPCNSYVDTDGDVAEGEFGPQNVVGVDSAYEDDVTLLDFSGDFGANGSLGIPADATVGDAELELPEAQSMYKPASSSGISGTIEVAPLTHTFTPAATWYTYDGTHAWSASRSGLAYGAVASESVTDIGSNSPQGIDPYPVDITSIVQSWVNESNPVQAVAVLPQTDGADSVEWTEGEVSIVVNFTAPEDPTNFSAPGVSGRPVVGQTLTAETGEWTGSLTGGYTYAYTWEDCSSTAETTCTPISGATGSSYEVRSSDSGYYIAPIVTATDSGGTSAPVAGNASGLVATAGSYVGQVQLADPAAFWQLNDAANQPAIDASGDRFDGGYAGLTAAMMDQVGPFPGAGSVALSGAASDYVSVPDNPFEEFGPFSEEVWFKTSSPSGILVSQQASGSGTPQDNSLLYVDAGGDLEGSLWSDGNSQPLSSVEPVDDGKWHEAVLTVDAQGDQTLYLDGVSQGSDTLGQVLAASIYSTIGAGNGNDWPNAPSGQTGFDGNISDVALYDSDLSPTTVEAQYFTAVPSAPTSSGPPIVDGGGEVGDTLTATIQPWYGSQPLTISYQWEDCTSVAETVCGAISGATSSMYTLRPSDEGSYVAVVASATNSVGTTRKTSDADSYDDAVLNTDPPLAFWNFSDLDNPRSDLTGNGNTVFVDAGAAASGGPDGSSQCEECILRLPSALPDLSNFTVEFWEKGQGFIYPKNTSFCNDEPYLDFATEGRVATFQDSSDSNTQFNTNVDNGLWHYVVITRSASGEDYVYVDGNRVYSLRAGTSPMPLSCVWFDFDHFAGGVHDAIADVALYPTVLSQADVASHWQRRPEITNAYGELTVPTQSASLGRGAALKHSNTCIGGNPGTVDCASGDMDDSFTDINVPGTGGGLTVSRTYSSLEASQVGEFGGGWSCSFCWSLAPGGAGDVTITEGDGSQVVATTNGAGGYDVPAIYDSTLTQDADGSWTFVRQHGDAYTFNAAGQLAGITDLNGYTTALSYTAGGLLSSITNADGQHLSVAENSGGQIASITDPLGLETTYGYNSEGELTSVTNQDGDEWQYGYNAAGDMTTLTNPDGNSITTQFDSAGRVLNQTQANGAEWRYSYSGDPFSGGGGSTVITDPDGHQELQVYASGNLVSLTKGYGTVNAETWSYAYDPSTGGMTSETDPRGYTTTYTYDADGNRLSETDPLGRQSTWTYNSLDEVLTATDPLGVATLDSYDARGNLLASKTPLVNSSGVQTAEKLTTYTYGNASLPGYATVANVVGGHQANIGYNADGDMTSSTDGLGNETTYVYDADGRLTSETAPEGNVSGCACAASYTTNYSYNVLGEPLRMTDADGNATINVYDADGNRISTAEPSGSKTVTTYNKVDEPAHVQVEDASGAVKEITTTGYDPDGNITSQTDGNHSETTYGYNALNQQATTTNVLGETTTNTYDADGDLSAELKPNGVLVTDSYNADDEVIGTSYSDSSAPSVSYSYDADGRTTGMTDGTGTSSWTYDIWGDLTSYTNGAGREVQYEVDADGNPTSITYPGNKVVTQTFDLDDDLKSLTDWNGNESTFGYDPDGNVTTESLPNGVTDSYSYDHADNLTGIDDATHSAAVFHATYALNSDELVASDSSQPAATGSYGYTGLDQLCYAGSETSLACSTPPSGADGYSYDQAGNLTDDNGVTQAYNAGSELCWSYAGGSSNGCSNAPVGATTYSYDGDGNRTAATPAAGGATSYGYNGSDELTSYQLGSNSGTGYAYDGNGLLQSETTGSTPTTYTWGPSASIPALLQQTTGGSTASYIYGPEGLPLEEILPSGATYYYAHDDLGSTRALTDATGAVQDTDDYDPYGNTSSSTGSVTNPLLYTGALQDPHSGLYYLQVRFYDPTTAQFLTVDPLVAGTGQPYSYANDDPIENTDPTGDAANRGPQLSDAEKQALQKQKDGQPLTPQEQKLAAAGQRKENAQQKYGGTRNKQKERGQPNKMSIPNWTPPNLVTTSAGTPAPVCEPPTIQWSPSGVIADPVPDSPPLSESLTPPNQQPVTIVL